MGIRSASREPAFFPAFLKRCTGAGFLVFLAALAAGFYAGRHVPPTWSVEQIAIDVSRDDGGRLFYVFEGKPVVISKISPLADAELSRKNIAALNAGGRSPGIKEQFASQAVVENGQTKTLYYRLGAKCHWGAWSLLPAVAAIALCWITREPLFAIFAGIAVGSLLLARYDLTDAVFLNSLATPDAAGVLLLYLFLLGGLLGVWSRTGAAIAFADMMTKKFVRGPRSAKIVAWTLGVLFFQGGSISTVLVGTTVKSLADRERVSHEELSYIVDSTASPIAVLLAFNAWPGYVQAFIFVAGVPWLATEADRIRFFFSSVPLSFYAIFAVTLTLLLSLDVTPFVGRRMKEAIHRSRQTGRLDHPDAEPLTAPELYAAHVPEGFTPHVVDFFAPLLLLIAIAVGTFIHGGSPQVRWAFAAALGLAIALALLRDMKLKTLMEGLADGFKGASLGAIILLLAVTLGRISSDTGGGIYLIDLLGGRIPYWALPVMLQVMTIIIAFSTGTSWGTFAVSFPLAMPLSWAVAQSAGLEHPMLYMSVCFATVMNGSVYGDQCSPISDTTVLSAMCTGCDLMDHVRTQLPQASAAALLAAICWTVLAAFC